MRLVKAAGVWLVLLFCAVLNGTFREAALLPHLEKTLAFVLSGILLSLCIVAVTFVLAPRLGFARTKDALYMGLFWLVLTLVFEFAFGRIVQHRDWTELLEAYTFKDGNIWPLVLIVTLFAPLIAMRLRSEPPQASGEGGAASPSRRMSDS